MKSFYCLIAIFTSVNVGTTKGEYQSVMSERYQKNSTNRDNGNVQEQDPTSMTKKRTNKKKHKSFPYRETVQLEQPPSARDAAFRGPPRYDWIDIETSAVIKVQSAYRRYLALKQLERQNRTTAYMRNRIRRRKAKQKQFGNIFRKTNDDKNNNTKNAQYTVRQQPEGGNDVPFLFRCCGVGLLFGESTEESFLMTKQHEKENYLNQQKERYEKEEYLRQSYGKALKDKVQRNYLERQEAYEVVE